MPEDMKKKMARLRAMRKPKKGGQDPFAATLKQLVTICIYSRTYRW